MKFAKQRILFVGVHLVNSKKKRLTRPSQQPSQFAVGSGDLGASIDDHHNRRRFFKRNFGLAKNLRRYEVLVVWDDAARIDHAELVSKPFRLAIEAVARDAGLIADNGAPRSGEMVEERRFANVGASDDSDEWGWFLFAQSD
jgi:hypothetical protein